MRTRVFLTVFAALLITSACSRAAEITSPTTPVPPVHTDIADDSTNRGPGTYGGGARGPGLFGSGN